MSAMASRRLPFLGAAVVACAVAGALPVGASARAGAAARRARPVLVGAAARAC